MNSKLKKVISDLRVNPGRIILVIFALIIGLWGVGSILVSYTILSRDLNENFVRTGPLHAAMTSGDFSRLDLAALNSRPEIEKALVEAVERERGEAKREQSTHEVTRRE